MNLKVIKIVRTLINSNYIYLNYTDTVYIFMSDIHAG